MNRFTENPGPAQPLLHGSDADHPLEALVLDRDKFIRVLRQSLTDLHDHRRRTTGTPAHPDAVDLVRYWDAVLGWAKEQHRTDVVLMSRRL